MQLPSHAADALRIIWDAKTFNEEDSTRTLSLEVPPGPLCDVLAQIDERNVREAFARVPNKNGRFDSIEKVREIYKPILRDTTNGSKFLSVKLRFGDARSPPNVYVVREVDGDEHRYTPAGPEVLVRNNRAAVTLETPGLWFSDKTGFSMTLLATNVIVWEQEGGTPASGVARFHLGGMTLTERQAPLKRAREDDDEI